MVKKIIIHKEGNYFYTEGDVHTKRGVLKEEDILNKKEIPNIKGTFHIFEAKFNDKLQKIKRGPAIVQNKDIGPLLTDTNINKDSIVLEAGTGCGVVTSHLSRFVKKIISYEIKEENIKIAKKNFALLETNNIEIKNKDIREGIEEKELDLIFLDLPESEKIIEHAYNSLKESSYLVIYVPTTEQIKEVIENRNRFYIEKIIEVLQREWQIKPLRPKNQMLGHTAFLIFLRK